MRQRKALSRTSSNILLNSVHIQHASHHLHPHHSSSNYQRSSECDIGVTIKEIHMDTHSELSDLDVSLIIIKLIYFASF